jgi:uncharacterized protein
MTLPPFHLAFAVDDLAAARAFYGELLQCPEGRSDKDWIDFNLCGHQVVAHLAPNSVPASAGSFIASLENWRRAFRTDSVRFWGIPSVH